MPKLFGLDSSTVRQITKLFALDGSTPRRVKKLFLRALKIKIQENLKT